MRVVVDTKVLVSFAIRPSKSFEKIFDFIAQNGVSLVCYETLAELYKILHREKFQKYVSKERLVDYIEWYADISEFIPIVEPIQACRDPSDDKFIALALAGNAECIIAGDSDLADMIGYKGIRIYRPADFLTVIAEF